MVKKRNETHRSEGSCSKKCGSKHDLSGSSDDSDGDSVVSNTVEVPKYKSDVECGICTTKYDAYVPSKDTFSSSSKNTLLATKVEQRKCGKKSLKKEDILNNFLSIGGNTGVCNKKCEMTLKRMDCDDGRDGRTHSKIVTWTASQSYVYSNSSSHRINAKTRDQSCNTCIEKSASETIKICKHCDRIFIGDSLVCATCREEKQKNRKSKRQKNDCKCKYCGNDIESSQKKNICYQCQLNLMTTYSPKVNNDSSNIKICLICGNVYESRDSSKVCKTCKSTLQSSSYTHQSQKRENDKCSCSSNQSFSFRDFKEPPFSSTRISDDHKSNSSYSDFKKPPLLRHYKSNCSDFDRCAFCSQLVRQEDYKKVCLTCINKYKNEEYDPLHSSFHNKEQGGSSSFLPTLKQEQVQYCTTPQKYETNKFPQNIKQEPTSYCSQIPNDTNSILLNKMQDSTKCCSQKPDDSFLQSKKLDSTKYSEQQDEAGKKDYCCKSGKGLGSSFENKQVSDTKYAPTKGCEDLNCSSKKYTSNPASNECAWCGKPLQKDIEVMCQDCKKFFADAKNKMNGDPSKMSCCACNSSTRDPSSRAVSETKTNTSNVRFDSRNDDDSDDNRSVRRNGRGTQ